MQTTGSKIIFTLFVICFLGLSGCGSDTYKGDYTTDVVFTENDNETMDLDMFQDVCPSGDPEPYTNVFAEISIDIASFAPGLKINGYVIEYLPLISPDGSGAATPPTLRALTDDGSYSLYLPSNSSNSFTITCFSVDQKEEFWSLRPAALEISRYTIRIILRCEDDNGEGRNIEIRRTVYFGNYNNC